MSAIIDYFINTFVPLCVQTEESDVIISTLIESSKNWSPILLKYKEKTKSEKELAAAIIFNFCKNYSELKEYPKVGIQTLYNIIRNELDVEVIAQQILLVHVSKMKVDVNTSVFYITQISGMKIVEEEPENVQYWKDLAKKVIQHKHINKIINESIEHFGLSATTADESIQISFVKDVTTLVRGFVGFNEIFINVEHFYKKIKDFTGDDDLLQLILKIDIITLALHEYSHVRIRKHTGNFNVSSHILANLKKLEPSEFGVYNEVRLFNSQVDWFSSAEQNIELLDVKRIEQFITAIETGSMLPIGSISGTLPRIQSPGMGGADIQLKSYIC